MAKSYDNGKNLVKKFLSLPGILIASRDCKIPRFRFLLVNRLFLNNSRLEMEKRKIVILFLLYGLKLEISRSKYLVIYFRATRKARLI